MEGPSSWADDLQNYRRTRGSMAFSVVQNASDVPRRIVRTTIMPLADPTHPYFSYQEPPYRPSTKDGSLERYARHGVDPFAYATYTIY
jgi:hypothetical protein